MDDMMKTRGGDMGGKEWRRWIVVGWLWIPNVMAEAECCRKMNPMPRWSGSSSSCLLYSSNDSTLYSRLTLDLN
jgi:hypothetical protein